MEREAFEALAEKALSEIPEELLSRVENVVVLVEDWPDRETLDSLGYQRRSELLGLYQGIPLDARHVGLTGNLPDRIVLYQRSLERYATLFGLDLEDTIYETILHEMGHYLGLDDEELHRLESGEHRG
ncbi:MAG: metallopeptidase family protein [Deltaproteobacteria bacterium]|nr:metallopeptidase family protein [Deltaproteobacteria bacterium]